MRVAVRAAAFVAGESLGGDLRDRSERGRGVQHPRAVPPRSGRRRGAFSHASLLRLLLRLRQKCVWAAGLPDRLLRADREVLSVALLLLPARGRVLLLQELALPALPARSLPSSDADGRRAGGLRNDPQQLAARQLPLRPRQSERRAIARLARLRRHLPVQDGGPPRQPVLARQREILPRVLHRQNRRFLLLRQSLARRLQRNALAERRHERRPESRGRLRARAQGIRLLSLQFQRVRSRGSQEGEGDGESLAARQRCRGNQALDRLHGLDGVQGVRGVRGVLQGGDGAQYWIDYGAHSFSQLQLQQS